MLGLLLLSAAGLTYQVTLIRLFSVSQFYHFAFMIVSIAMLGYGGSGTVLAISPRIHSASAGRWLSLLALATASSILGSYLLINRLPFDSFSIAWDAKQVWILVMHYIALASPFFFSGMAVGFLLAAYPAQSGKSYAVNLLGSALGCLVGLAAPSYLGGEGVVSLSCALASMAALASWIGSGAQSNHRKPTGSFGKFREHIPGQILLAVVLLCLALVDLGLRASGRPGASWLSLHLSPYKSLSYALQVPQAELIFQRWNSTSRVDLVHSPGIHSFPGLSYRFLEDLPRADGMTIDGDDLVPIISPAGNLEFTSYLPAAIAYQLRPGAEALILEPRSGPDILVAFAQGASRIQVVEINPLVIAAAREIYDLPQLELSIESGRSYLRRSDNQFDVIVLSLTSSYHPVRSGAYTLAEDYRYTVEAFQDSLFRLNPDGLLMVTRWLQTPPSESLRTFALAVTAIERRAGDPTRQIVALRGYNTATFFVKNSPFNSIELQKLREFSEQRAFDLIHAPGLQADESNRFNILPEPVYYQAFAELMRAADRDDFYASYLYNVTPPTDDHPFFGHFFKWSQAGQVLSEMGKTWQPFGGAGYFVIFALLLLAIAVSTILILLPAAVLGQAKRIMQPSVTYLAYFGLIGFAFMLVEIPLIQRFILFLGHPAYAVTAVLFSLLAFSALGSRFSSRMPVKFAIGLLVPLLLAAPMYLPWVFQVALGQALPVRLAVTVAVIAPVGFLMGIPFPGGIQEMLVSQESATPIPWLWATNGAASVVSSVLAALLAISFGFDWVLRIGALCYVGAWFAINRGAKTALPPPPAQ